MLPTKYLNQIWDKELQGLAIIESVHRMVHRGRMFIASYKTPDASPLADNAALLILVSTGAREAHMQFAVNTGAEGEIELFEGTTTSNDGTELSVFNLKRYENLMIPTTNVFHTPTVTNNGVSLLNIMVTGGSTPQSRSGGTVREGTEWELKPNTKYLVKITNRGGSAQQASCAVQFYETD